MPIHDEDDDYSFQRSRSDSRDEYADEHEMTSPDDFTTVKCTRCGKLIFEDTECCPYCRHYQMEDERSRKPMWFVLTAIVCIAMLSGVVALLLMGRFAWIF